MPRLLEDWSNEKINSLAPDTVIGQSGKQLAIRFDSRWQSLGSDGASAWASFDGGEEKPYQIKLNLYKLQQEESIWECTCRSYKKPCKHIIALLHLWIEQPEQFEATSAPAWVEDWLDKASKSARKRANRQRKDRQLSEAQIREREKQHEKRKAMIAEGLNELEQWMLNMIRRGLADPQVRSYEFWDSRAARMVDAQAPAIAQWIREMGSIPARGTEWIEPLLEELGRLYLLIESFKRYDLLTYETQADIRSAMGWQMKPDELKPEEAEVVSDTWIVLGRFTGEMNERVRSQRIWLRGEETGRDVLIAEFSAGENLFETHLRPGWSLEGEMSFYPSRYRLRAYLSEKLSEVKAHRPIAGESIHSSIENYAYALSQNPWIGQFPFFLDKVIPIRLEEEWILREVNGTYLPIAKNFAHTWSLLAVSGGHPIQVAGEWDGKTFHPTGAVDRGRFVDFALIGKL